MARISKKYAPPARWKPERAPEAVAESAPDAEIVVGTNGHVSAAAIPVPDAGEMRRAIAENVWLHFTQMHEFAEGGRLERPTVIVRGEGSHIWDTEGNEYIDGLAGLFCVNVGYGRTEIAQAMMAQLEQIHFVSPFSFPNVPGTVLADRLAKIAPTGEGCRSFFVTGGSEAGEAARKVAKGYPSQPGNPGRYRTISRRYPYPRPT